MDKEDKTFFRKYTFTRFKLGKKAIEIFDELKSTWVNSPAYCTICDYV